MTNRRRALIALAAGLTLALAAPPFEFWPATFVSLALFAWSVDGANARRGLLSGWIMGTSATLGAFYWVIGTVTRFTDLPLAAAVLAYVLMAALAGLTLASAGVVAGAFGRVLGYPVALALGVIVAERYAPSIFPWQAASPLIVAPWVRQAGDLVGVTGLGAILCGTLMVFVRAARAWLASRKGVAEVTAPPRWQLALAGGLFAFLWVYGGIRTGMVERAMAQAPTLRVGLVQPNIQPTVRWDTLSHAQILETLQNQTDEARARGARLVVWSEAAYPFLLPHRAGIDGEISPPAYEGEGPSPPPTIVVGAVTEDARGRHYNAAVLRHPDGTLSAPVAKRMLVPFGEYLPVVGEIAWVRRTFSRAEGLARGDRAPVLGLQTGRRIGVLNCFEDTMAVVGAELARTDLLVNITNDAWFGDGPAPWQHLMLARWRTIETRREMVRAVNTGVTTHVDALGRLAQHAPIWRRATLVVDARLMDGRTLAPLFIAYAPPASLVVLGGAALVALARRRRARRGEAPPPAPEPAP